MWKVIVELFLALVTPQRFIITLCFFFLGTPRDRDHHFVFVSSVKAKCDLNSIILNYFVTCISFPVTAKKKKPTPRCCGSQKIVPGSNYFMFLLVHLSGFCLGTPAFSAFDALHLFD